MTPYSYAEVKYYSVYIINIININQNTDVLQASLQYSYTTAHVACKTNPNPRDDPRQRRACIVPTAGSQFHSTKLDV